MSASRISRGAASTSARRAPASAAGSSRRPASAAGQTPSATQGESSYTGPKRARNCAWVRSLTGMRMPLAPVPRDLDAAAEPDVTMDERMPQEPLQPGQLPGPSGQAAVQADGQHLRRGLPLGVEHVEGVAQIDRKSTRLNSSHSQISYAVFC